MQVPTAPFAPFGVTLSGESSDARSALSVRVGGHDVASVVSLTYPIVRQVRGRVTA